MSKSQYKLRPSSSQRFLTCTASLPYNLGFSENIYTLKGNLQHKVAFLRLDQYFNDNDHDKEIEKLTNPDNDFISKNDKELKTHWDNGCEKTVDSYISYVKRLEKQFKPKMVFLEYFIKMKFYGNKINGVVDLAMVMDNNNIIIVDLKTGYNKVEAEDNSQMLMYGYGMIQDLYKKTKKTPKKIIISIAQSSINNTIAVEYSLNQMIQWYKDQARPLKEINTNKLVFRPSPKACKYCEHRDECNERIRQGVV